MNLETYTRGQMARFAIEEMARHGGVTNMLAVALVLRNRVFAGWGDWLEVVTTAPAKRGTVYPAAAIDLRTSNVRVFLNRLDEVYQARDVEDITGGALFYLEPAAAGLPIAQWFQDEVLGKPAEHMRTAHIGPVWFFR